MPRILASIIAFSFAVSTAATAQTHPTSVWTSSELSTLQANATQPGWADLWSGRLPFPNPNGLVGANLTQFITRYSTADAVRNSGEYQPAFQAGGYAMIARLTNQSVSVARDLVLSMCSLPGSPPPANSSLFTAFDWTQDPNHNDPPPNDCDMEQAGAVRSLAIGLDVLFDQLTPSQQQQCLQTLQYYTDSLARVADTANTSKRTPNCGNWTGWWQGDFGNTHSWTTNTAIGLAGQVLEGTTALTALDVNGVSRTYDYLARNYYQPIAAANLGRIRALQDLVSDGTWHEGTGYLMTGMQPLVAYWIGARRRGGTGWNADQSALLQNFGRVVYYLQQPDHPQVMAMTNADYNWLRPGVLPVLRWAANRYQNASNDPGVTTDRVGASFAKAAADRFPADQRSYWLMRFEFALHYALEYVVYSNAPAVSGAPPDLWNQDQQSFISHGYGGLIVAFKSGVFGGNGLRQKCIDLTATCADPTCAAAMPELNFGHDHEDDLGLWIYGGAAVQPSWQNPTMIAGWSLPEAAGYNCCADPNDPHPDGGVGTDHEHSTEWHNAVLVDGAGQRGDDKVTQRHRSVGCYWQLPDWFLNRVGSMPVAASMTDYTFARGDGTRLYDNVSALSRTVIVGRDGYVIVRDLVQENRTTGQGSVTQLYHALNPAGTVRLTDGVGVLLDNSVADAAPNNAVPSTTSMSVRVVAPVSPTIDIAPQTDDAHQLYYLTPWAGSYSEFFSPTGTYAKVKISAPVASPSYAASVITVLQPKNPNANIPGTPFIPQELAVSALASSNPEAGVQVGNDSWVFGKLGATSNTAGGVTIAGGTSGLEAGMVRYRGSHEPAVLVLHADGANATLSDAFGLGGAARTLIRSQSAGQTIEVTTDANNVAQITGHSDGHRDLSILGLRFLAYRVNSVALNGQSVSFTESNGLVTVTSMSAPNPPRIPPSSIQLQRLSNTSVKISWTTDSSADTQIRYTTRSGGLHTDSGIYTYTAVTDVAGTTSHQMQLDGLVPENIYQFWARSSNSGGIAFADAGAIDVWVNAGVEAAQNWHVLVGSAGTADYLSAVTTDAAGNTYVAGQTTGVLGTNVTANGGGTDGFVRKLDGAGNTVWTRQYATTLDDEIVSLAVDGSTLYALTGSSFGAYGSAPVILKYGLDGSLLATLPVGNPALTSAYALALGRSSHDLYIQGNALVRMTAGGAQVWRQPLTNLGFGIAVDPSEQSVYVVASSCAYCTGQVAPGALLYGYSAATGAQNWTADAINSTTSLIDSAHCVASMAMATAADATGVYVTGWCADSWIYGNDSDVNPNSRRVFVGRYTPPQTTPVFFKKSGLQLGLAWAWAIAASPTGIYVGGSTDAPYFASVIPPAGPMQFTSDDAFFAKFTVDGALAWGAQFGTGLADRVQAVAVDPAGNATFAGWTGGNALDKSTTDGFVRQYAPQTTPATVPPAGDRPHWLAASAQVERAAATQIDTTKWYPWAGPDGLATITESGGSINLSPAPGNGGSQALVESIGTYELTNSSASVQILSVVSATGNVNTVFTVQLDWNNQLNWWYEYGYLYANYVLNGVQYPVATLTYNPIVHAYWRLRESDGTTCWETSSDGTQWTLQATAPTSTLFSLKALNYILSASEFSTGNPTPGTASFTNMNPP